MESLLKEGKQDSAQKIVDECRDGDLSEMIKLFEEVRKHLRDDNREIAVVLEGESKNFAIAVDSVESVEMLEEFSKGDNAEHFLGNIEEGFLASFGKRQKSKEFVMILRRSRIINNEELKMAGEYQ